MSITAADIRREVKEKNVTFIRLMFSDILGTMKNVEIPATDEQLDKVLSNKAMFDGSSIEGFVRINESDMYLYPDLDTWTVFPWGDENGSVAGLICDVYTTEGEPFAGDPRGNLNVPFVIWKSLDSNPLTLVQNQNSSSSSWTKMEIQLLK